MSPDSPNVTIAGASAYAYVHCMVGRKRILGCLILSVLIGAAAMRTTREPWHDGGLACAVFLICGVGYLVWADERNRFVKVCRYLDNPDICCTVHSCQAWAAGRSTYLIIHADIMNRSLVSATLKSATLELAVDGEEWRATAACPLQLEDMWRVAGLRPAQLQSRNFTDLISQASVYPLERGVHRSGAFIFEFERLPELPRVMLTRLALEDAFGNTHRAESHLRGSQGFWLNLGGSAASQVDEAVVV